MTRLKVKDTEHLQPGSLPGTCSITLPGHPGSLVRVKNKYQTASSYSDEHLRAQPLFLPTMTQLKHYALPFIWNFQ
ncbi:hypothetical protein E2C01_004656 [Portunus trituberculatus]|uniref:Uncharacterized protein n=1 Tax=Portunus trituberculatus TaxID=210409 RepID=A0A5B7CS96_PORTR|nr:hypothetical protein [Portunus trituberculatus]